MKIFKCNDEMFKFKLKPKFICFVLILTVQRRLNRRVQILDGR